MISHIFFVILKPHVLAYFGQLSHIEPIVMFQEEI